MIWLLRAWRWFFPSPFFVLLNKAQRSGRVSLQEVDLGKGKTGWYASIRPPNAGKGPHAHRYAWTGQARSIDIALAEAVAEACEFPVMVDMTEGAYAPKLGGREYDE